MSPANTNAHNDFADSIPTKSDGLRPVPRKRSQLVEFARGIAVSWAVFVVAMGMAAGAGLIASSLWQAFKLGWKVWP